jgi:hypothetical protein
LLEKIRSNIASLEPMRRVPPAASSHSERANRVAVRNRRERTAVQR